jgi:hypothetical protein
MSRQLDREHCAASLPIPGDDRTVVTLDDVLRDGQAKTKASVRARHRRIRLAELFEHMGQELGCDTRAIVFH